MGELLQPVGARVTINFNGLDLTRDWVRDKHDILPGLRKCLVVFAERQTAQASAAHSKFSDARLHRSVGAEFCIAAARIICAGLEGHSGIAVIVRFLDPGFTETSDD